MTPLLVHSATDEFEKLYLRLREKEGRVYTDDEVGELPDIAATHVHFNEWQMRKRSCEKLAEYVRRKPSRPADEEKLKILEIGCGNGWLSHRLSVIPGTHVIGTDINFSEIRQATKVFRDRSNLQFVHCYPGSQAFKNSRFDMIVFAASIQYFSSLKEIMQEWLQRLNANGEIHIIDSFFYHPTELAAARQRSLNYFEAAGFPEMINWYFHHSLDDLRPFNYSMRYDPNSLFNKLSLKKHPFPWICIKQ